MKVKNLVHAFLLLWLIVFGVFIFKGHRYCERLKSLKPAVVRQITLLHGFGEGQVRINLDTAQREQFLQLISQSQASSPSKVTGGTVWQVFISAEGEDFELLLHLDTSRGSFLSRRGGSSFENLSNEKFPAWIDQLTILRTSNEPSDDRTLEPPVPK